MLRRKSLVGSNLRSSKHGAAPVLSPDESGEWANEFEKDVSDLVMGLSKGGFGATPMGDSVAKIAALIEKDMMPKVLGAHETDQKQLTKLAKDIESCGSVMTTEMTAALKRKTIYETNSKSH